MPQVPTGWEETTLGEVVDIIMGQSPKWETYNEKGEGIPFYQWITEFWEKFVRIKTYSSEPIKIVEPNTILFSVRAPVWKINITKHKACIGRWNAWLFMKNKEQEFLFYLLKYLEKQFLNRSSGTVFDSINRTEIENFPIQLPPLPEQQAIAAVLSSFDDKIELLRAENQTLEQMGQELFKERFEAPQPPKGGAYFSQPAEDSAHSGILGAEKKSSSEVVGAEGKSPSGDLGASLPEGWRVGKLGEMGIIICWKTPSKNNWDFFWWNIPFIKIPDMHWNLFILKTEDSLTEEGADSQKNKYISEWAICVSCIATVGLVSLTTKSSQTNQQINSIIPKFDNYREYLYYSLVWMKNELLAIGAWWSATLNINTTTFSNISIIIPDQETLYKFDLVIKPLFNKIRANSEQIQTLSATRDQLLPKLMSWEVRVEF